MYGLLDLFVFKAVLSACMLSVTGPGEDIEVPLPQVRVISSTAKTETCERHIPKLMMRGEHVVLVIAMAI